MNQLYPNGLVARSELLRPLGTAERMFWLLDRKHPFHFAVAAEIEGRTSPADWLDALDQLQARHPLLSVAIDDQGGEPRFRRDMGAAIPLRVIASDDPSARLNSEIAAELAERFDPTRPPLARAVLIHAPGRASFIMTAHHAIADGLSLAYAIRDVLQAVAGEKLEGLPLLPSQDELLGNALAASDAEPAQAEDATPSDLPPGVYRKADCVRPQISGVVLQPAHTAKLRDRARREGTTVHSAIITAFALAAREVAPALRNRPLRVISPVNTRPAVGVGEDVALHVSAAFNRFEPDLEMFWETARLARPGLAAGQSRAGVCAFLSNIRPAVERCDVGVAADVAVVALASEAVISNLGALSFGPKFGPLRLKALWGPSVLGGMENEQIVGVATVGDVLTLIHTSHAPHPGLLEAMRDVLLEACAA